MLPTFQYTEELFQPTKSIFLSCYDGREEDDDESSIRAGAPPGGMTRLAIFAVSRLAVQYLQVKSTAELRGAW